MPLKNEFRVTEPAPEAPEVKREGLGKGRGTGEERLLPWEPWRKPTGSEVF